MEAIVSARKLKEQVAGLQGILAKKETVPILSRIKIEAKPDGDLIMSATDLEVSLTASQEVDVLSSGSIWACDSNGTIFYYLRLKLLKLIFNKNGLIRLTSMISAFTQNRN